MLGNDPTVLADHDAVRIGLDLNRPPDRARCHRVLVVFDGFHAAPDRSWRPRQVRHGSHRTDPHKARAWVARPRRPPRWSGRRTPDADAPWRRQYIYRATSRSARRAS